MLRQRRWTVLLLAVALLGGLGLLATHGLAQEPTPDELLKTGDEMYAEKSYRQAQEAYDKYLQSGADAEKARVMRNLGICAWRLSEFDQALAVQEAAARDFAGTKNEVLARRQRLMMRLSMPDYYYEKDDKKYWGRWVQQARYHNVRNENRTDAMANARAAHDLWAELLQGMERPGLEDVQLLAQLKMELASLVESDDAANGWEMQTVRVELPDGEIREYQERVNTWPHKDEVIALYDAAEQLYARTANLGADREAVLHGGLALYRKAMFFCHMAQLGNFRFGPQNDDRQRSTLPTVDNPMPVLREVIEKYPDSRRAPEAWYAIANIKRQTGDFVGCLEELRTLRATYPKSKWVSDTHGVEQSITMPRLSVSGPTSIQPGDKLTLSVRSRNVDEIAFTAYRFHLTGLMTDRQFLDDPNARLDNLSQLANRSYMNRFRGDELGSWSVKTNDEGQHLYFASDAVTADVPDDYRGAFLVEATAGNITISSLHVRTERVVMVRTDPAASLWWFVDRESGEPLANAQFHYKEYFRWRVNRTNHYGTSDQQMAGDDAGVVRRDNVVRGPRVPGNAYTQGVICVAVDGDGAFALTNTAQPRAWANDWRDHYRWMTWTERPVYRPEQQVYFRGILKHYLQTKADFENVANRDLTWEVRDPRNQKVADGRVTTSPVGTFHADLELGEEATLGTYRVTVRFPDNNRIAHAFGFRVEEYKKPEFEVSVTPSSDRVKLGKEGEAKVSVRYYSGEPVSGAKLSYRVYRQFHWRSYHFPRDWDWFYADWVYQREHHGWGRDVVAQGEAEADANGEFVVTFPTEHAAKTWPELKHNYTIEVQATDESRRTINGAGSILVTKQAFDAYVQTRRNLYTPGDRVEFEVRTETPAGKPVRTKGQLHIGRLDVYWTTEEDDDGNTIRVRKREEKFFHSIDVETDAEGRGFVQWTMDSAGAFVVKFETEDPDGETVSASHDFLVAGNEDNLESTRFSELRIVPEQRVYEIGDTARVALTAVEKGTFVMFRVETGQDRAPYEIHRLDGRATVIDIPIPKRLVPNFFVTAYAVRDGVVQEARVELFVMPMNRLLNVELDSEKDEYLPGSTGNVKLKVTDRDGNPVQAEASVGVVDASLYYIAPDNTPDPRTYYYKRRRGFSTNTYSSLTFRSGGHRADTNDYKAYQNHGTVEGWSLGWGGWVRHDLQLRRNRLGGPAPETGWKPVSLEGAEHDEQAMAPPRDANNPDGNGFGGRRAGWGRADRSRSTGDGAPGNRFGGQGGGGMDSPNAPMDDADSGAEPEPEAGEALRGGRQEEKAQANGGPGGPQMAAPQVRRDFRDLAAWHPAVVTGEDGTASVEVKWPDNLTRWKTNVVVVDDQNRMGYATLSLTTTKHIKVRLQAPRFFVETDEVVLTAVVSNDLKTAKDVQVKITVPEHLELMAPTPAEVTLKLGPGERDRVDWRVKVVKPGMVTVRMDALTDEESDAQEMTFPAYIHGATKHAIVTGRIDGEVGEAEAEVRINVPEEVDPARTQLRISINPTVVNSALDALPYLIRYPYGCVEQTMSRFMPAVAVRKTLSDLGVNLEDVAAKRQNVNLEAWPAHYQVHYRSNPAFDQAVLNDVIRKGLARLYDFQHSDGGWGWWKGGHSDPYMTAYVLQGFIIALEADVAIDQSRLQRGLQYLASTFSAEKNLHRAAYLSHVLAFAKANGMLPEAIQARLNDYVTQVYEKREHLGNYTRALLLMSLHWLERAEETAIVKRNLVGYAHHDNDNSTSWFGQPGESGWWWWHNDRIEQNAWALRALNLVEPDHELVPRVTKWLVNNRKGNRWHSTRATAFAVLALADHARVHRELDAEYQLDVELDGKVLRTIQVTRANMFALDGEVFLTGAEVRPGPHTLRLVRRGMGACYFTADLEYFEKSEGIEAAGHEIFVKRTYYTLTERFEELPDGRKIQKWDREELKEGQVLESGQLIEVELRIDAKNDYEYLCFEDWKPAGCEPLSMRSGGHWANGIWVYREFRDEKVVMFVGRMQQGYIKLDYRMRCEIPGRFHALPTQGYGMYAPDLKANSAEAIITIQDADNE